MAAANRIDRALITGASAGIGEAFARQLATRGVDLVVVARREDGLHRLATQLRSAAGVDVEVLPADLTEPAGLEAVEQRLLGTDPPVHLLVNNAGFGAYGRFTDLDLARQTSMVELHVTAVVRLTHAALGRLEPLGRGGVINVASTAAFQPDPHGAAYGATKAFVRSFSEALHEELSGSGVRVMTLCPGYTETEFQRVAGVRADAVPAPAAMDAGSVVATALTDFARGRAVSVPGLLNKLTAYGADVTPSVVSRRLSGLVHDHWSSGARPVATLDRDGPADRETT